MSLASGARVFTQVNGLAECADEYDFLASAHSDSLRLDVTRSMSAVFSPAYMGRVISESAKASVFGNEPAKFR